MKGFSEEQIDAFRYIMLLENIFNNESLSDEAKERAIDRVKMGNLIDFLNGKAVPQHCLPKLP